MQIQLTDEQSMALREAASQEQASIAEIVRRAVDRWLASRGEVGIEARRRAAIDAPSFETGVADLAEHHDRYLGDDEAA